MYTSLSFNPMLLLRLVVLVTLMLSACTPKTPTPAPAQEQSTTANASLPPTPTPAPPTINLLGPQRGTSMAWVDGSTLVFVPEGKFIMGDGGEDNPEHEVYLSDFWIYRAEVTNQQYALCVAAGKCSLPKTQNASKRLTDRLYREHPVVGVDWAQAEAYCQWVDGRLPTEAQWEKTARGPEGNLYPWGESAPDCSLGNFNDCIGQTSKVNEHLQGKSYYDALGMTGNVFEWVTDWYKAQYYSESPERDPIGPEIGTVRSVRSSSYLSSLGDLRPAKRFYLAPDQARADLGFRCVIEAPRYYPPFCETNIGQPVPETPGQPGSSGTTSGVGSRVAGRGCGFATADISGGTIQSVEASGLNCEIVDGTRIYCSGPDSATGSVVVCVQGKQETSPNMIGSCPPGYTPNPNDPTRCNYISEAPMATEITCFGETCLLPTTNEGGGCGPGAYFDTLAERCVSYGQPDGECLPGYEFDTQALCCRSNSGEYPGCFSTEQCLPGVSSGGSNCIEFSLSMGVCPQRSGGGNSCSGLGLAACINNPNCFWDTGLGRCQTINP